MAALLAPVVSNHQQSLFTTASSSFHFLTPYSLMNHCSISLISASVPVAFPGPQQPMRTLHSWP